MKKILLFFCLLSGGLFGSGKLLFTPIPNLPDNWWNDPGATKRVWANTYYLWGANTGNYRKFDPQSFLSGSGLASKKGPTHGRGNPQYIGVITTSRSFKKNNKVFQDLKEKLLAGANIAVPVYDGKISLGAGVAYKRYKNKAHWYQSQKYLLEKIAVLGSLASSVEIPEGTFWSDVGKSKLFGKPVSISVRSLEDLLQIADAI